VLSQCELSSCELSSCELSSCEAWAWTEKVNQWRRRSAERSRQRPQQLAGRAPSAHTAEAALEKAVL
jgi:hypothetical protein